MSRLQNRFSLVLGVICGLATGVSALAVAADTRFDRFSSQTRLLDTRGATQYANSSRLQPQSEAISLGIPSYSGSYSGPYIDMARSAARRHGVPEDLFLRLVTQESNWNQNALSHRGAMGLAQLMPGTARYLGVNPTDPAENLEGGARYLAEQYRTFGSWRLALAAYNAGPGAVEQYNGVPPYRETQGYVLAILGVT
ncbi:MAG: soluble lytic murein transglycosylase-like protein [Paracoccaceae bacterium]|jgi:soluble lytic murein transglycosylase-like protein